MRTLAQSCLDILGSSRLAQFYQRDPNFDPHLEFAKQLGTRQPNIDLKTLRQRAKTANFGYPGGMSAGTFVAYARGYGLNISERESQDLRDTWLKHWPEMPRYFNHVSNIVGDHGYASMTLQRSGFRRGNCKYTDACNSYFQTLANHASKKALWEVSLKCFCDSDSYLYGSRPVLYIHDEIVLETPEEAGHEAAQEIEQVMARAMEVWTPDIPSRAEATLMRYWSKEAKKVFDNSGRLLPWEKKWT
jgi:DNA polymerase I-like protein with 3'-5' exonuclease and polymerase domains